MLSPDSDCAAESTCDEADPVSLAPRCTSVMWDDTCWVPCAACCTLREISCVAAPCSSTAAAMVEEISDSFSMVPLISLMAVTELLRRGLDAGDLLADLAGRLGGLLGQRLDFGGHHRKTATGLAGARRLDGGVERQQIGLARDGVDQFDHVADAGRRLRQFADAIVGVARLVDGVIGHPRRFLDLAADLVDRRGQFLGRRRHRLHVGGSFLGGGCDDGREFLRALGGRGQRTGGGFQFGRGRGHGLDDLADRAFEIVGELDHVGLALLRGDLVLLDLGFGFRLRLLGRDTS